MNLHQNDIFICDNYDITSHTMSKLFTTFFNEEELEQTIAEITRRYTILHNKIFILKIEGKDELIATYNVDSFNISDKVLPNTILLHRKKESNTLYSINSLNALIRELNFGKMDSMYPIEWSDYKNSILLVSDGLLNKYPTKIYSIINL
jgi:hypothetical protein